MGSYTEQHLDSTGIREAVKLFGSFFVAYMRESAHFRGEPPALAGTFSLGALPSIPGPLRALCEGVVNAHLSRNAAQPYSNDEELESRFKTAAAVFLELFDLLEAYAPAWYTEEHHNRAEAAHRALLRTRGASAKVWQCTNF
jgi:hypothetical protein